MKTRRGSAAGFTLVELMATVAIIGLVLLMTVPSFGSYIRSSRLAGARNTLVGDLRYARALASGQRSTYELRLASGSYSIVRLSPARTVLTRTLPRGVTIAARDTASFYPWGLTETMAITLQQGPQSKIVRTRANGQVTCD